MIVHRERDMKDRQRKRWTRRTRISSKRTTRAPSTGNGGDGTTNDRWGCGCVASKGMVARDSFSLQGRRRPGRGGSRHELGWVAACALAHSSIHQPSPERDGRQALVRVRVLAKSVGRRPGCSVGPENRQAVADMPITTAIPTNEEVNGDQ